MITLNFTIVCIYFFFMFHNYRFISLWKGRVRKLFGLSGKALSRRAGGGAGGVRLGINVDSSKANSLYMESANIIASSKLKVMLKQAMENAEESGRTKREKKSSHSAVVTSSTMEPEVTYSSDEENHIHDLSQFEPGSVLTMSPMPNKMWPLQLSISPVPLPAPESVPMAASREEIDVSTLHASWSRPNPVITNSNTLNSSMSSLRPSNPSLAPYQAFPTTVHHNIPNNNNNN